MSIPAEFHAAAVAELMDLGYYRRDPKIELRINKNTITLLSSSVIIPVKDEATVEVPFTKAPKGLKCIRQTFRLNDIKVEIPSKIEGLPVRGPTKDFYCVKFARTSNTVQQAEDDHRWRSPVTPFEVTFKYGKNHACGVGKLQKHVGLKLAGLYAYKQKYRYPMASFSGQGFTWFVTWLAGPAAMVAGAKPGASRGLRAKERERLVAILEGRLTTVVADKRQEMVKSWWKDAALSEHFAGSDYSGVVKLSPEQQIELRDLLIDLPATERPEERQALLFSLPQSITESIDLSGNRTFAMGELVRILGNWRQLPDGRWPTEVMLRNALRAAKDTGFEQRLQATCQTFEVSTPKSTAKRIVREAEALGVRKFRRPAILNLVRALRMRNHVDHEASGFLQAVERRLKGVVAT